MKKILFVTNNLNIGGIQKSLVDLLALISNDYEISVYCIDTKGTLRTSVPDNVRLIEGNKLSKVAEYDRQRCKEELGIGYSFMRVMASSMSKFVGRRVPAKILNTFAGKIEGEYDLAISFTQPFIDRKFENLGTEIVLQRVDAKKKATFIHCDYKMYGGDCSYNRTLYKMYDYIVGVSDSVGKQFSSCVPGLEDKIHTVYNYSKLDEIREKSEEKAVAYDVPTIVSISRLSEEKGLLRSLGQMVKLKSEGLEFQWVIVGDGPVRAELEKGINDSNMGDTVKLVGAQSNPYPYLKNASYLLLASFHEAAPMVFNEAACLNVPILTTGTLSANELVKDRSWGVVCDNTEEGIYAMLRTAITTGVEIGDSAFNVADLEGLVKSQFSKLLK